MKNVYFHGNNKSVEELEMAIQSGVRIIVDNQTELDRITLISKRSKQSASILIRLKPEIDAHTHEYIKTGQLDSKFGVAKDDLIDMINGIDHTAVSFLGIHAHIGSQIFDTKPFEDLAKMMATHCQDIQSLCGLDVQELNIGGGLGIRYTEDEQAPDISNTVATLAKSIKSAFNDAKMPLPMLIMEPGRSLIGTAGVTLYRVGTIKDIPNIRRYLFIDGGMADNPRPIMYQAKYTYEIANKANQPASECYSIAGRYCESGDILAKDVMLPKAELGDLILVYGTGAYNYAMSSNYNRFGKPAWVSVRDGQSKLILKAESLDDLIRNDVQ